MSTGNNSGNNSNNGGTIYIGAGGGGGVNYVPINGGWYTITLPSVPLPNQQITIDGIDLAVPVAAKKKDSDGCTCKKCKEFFPYAEPNQEDGTLVCYACRHGY